MCTEIGGEISNVYSGHIVSDTIVRKAKEGWKSKWRACSE